MSGLAGISFFPDGLSGVGIETEHYIFISAAFCRDMSFDLLVPEFLVDVALFYPRVELGLVVETFINNRLDFLVEIEKIIQQLAQNPSPDNQKMMEQANDIIQFTSEIVELFGGETS